MFSIWYEFIVFRTFFIGISVLFYEKRVKEVRYKENWVVWNIYDELE